MTTAHRISFVVTARDESPDVLAATIDGLLATSTGHSREIVVVDDASLVPVELEREDTRVFRNAVSLGVAQSRRMGVQLTGGDVLVCVDAHMRFGSGWLDHMLAYVDGGALLCAAWWDWELSRPLCWGGEFLWCGERNYKGGRSPGFTFRHLQRFPGNGAVDVPMIIGACYMMLRSSYDTVGGFSPFFRVWGKSEQDISARAWITGIGAKCVTGAKVAHLNRSKFPYPVKWADIEFNQLAMVRTVFEPRIAQRIEELMQPLPDEVKAWASQTNFVDWRRLVQSQRKITDAEFFRRFLPGAPEQLFQPAKPYWPKASSSVAALHPAQPGETLAANRLEVRVASLRCGGERAIVRWIASCCPGNVLLLKSPEPGTNPFFTCTSSVRLDLPGAPRVSKAKLNLFDRREGLIHAYRDRTLEDIFDQGFETQHDAWVGMSSQRRDVIVLRDAFNTFARRMAAEWAQHRSLHVPASDIELWKCYAREFLKPSSHIKKETVLVNYNRWLGEEEYRRGIAQRLGLAVLGAGLGNAAGELESFRRIANSACFRELFQDGELTALSDEIFGPIPGTELLSTPPSVR